MDWAAGCADTGAGALPAGDLTEAMCMHTRWVWGAILGLGGLYAWMRYFEWRNVYFPTREFAAKPDQLGMEFEDVDFMSEDARLLHGWWIPCANARGTVIHCHGNAGNIGDRVELAADLHRLRLNVFLFDYRGYGLSRGLPTETGTYADARAAYEVVRARYNDSERPPIIVHGQSLGGAVAIQLALDKSVRGLVVESSFTSVSDMARRLYALSIRFAGESRARDRAQTFCAQPQR